MFWLLLVLRLFSVMCRLSRLLNGGMVVFCIVGLSLVKFLLRLVSVG